MRTVVAAVAAITFAVAGCADSAPSGDGSTGVIGHRWTLVRLIDRFGALRLPAAVRADVAFAPDGEFSADDSVNNYSGRFMLAGSGYRLHDVAGSLVGSAGGGPQPGSRTVAAMAPLVDGSRRVPLRIRGTTLIVRTGDATLVFREAGPAPVPPTPPASPTATATPAGG